MTSPDEAGISVPLVGHNEGPEFCELDFSDNMAVRMITTSLKRLWLTHPPTDGNISNPGTWLAEKFKSAVGANCNYITSAALGDAWDDDLWRRKTHYQLLESPGAASELEGAEYPLVTWRNHITETYEHVFYDLYEPLKDELSYIGEFQPRRPDAVHCGTFIYPVWLDTGTSVTFAVGDQQHTWKTDDAPWTTAVWIKYRQDFTLTLETSDDRVSTGVAAVLARGHCEQREFMPPIQYENPPSGDEPYDPNEPEFATEAIHLARAVWLNAGDEVERCIFDNDYGGEGKEAVPKAASVAKGGLRELLYEPLPNNTSIRLLAIEPGDEEFALKTSLVVVNLEDAPTYEALSYTWGDPRNKISLVCAQASVPIPRSLGDFLIRLRYSDRPRYVWADAVCINQDDIEERGQQVSIMRDIFHRALRVVAWIGIDPFDQAKTAFTAVCDIVRSWGPSKDKLRYTSYGAAFEPLTTDQRQLLQSAVGEQAWTSLRSLFESSYFRRFWIIQELVLSKSAVIKHHISWSLIGVCATWLQTKGWDYQLGSPLTASYNAFLMISISECSVVSQHGSEINPEWPSWVPQWEKPYEAEPLALREEQGYYANAGELFMPDEETFSFDGEGLFLNGLECSIVSRVSEVLSKGKDGIQITSLSDERDQEAVMKLLQDLTTEHKRLRSSWSSQIEQFTTSGFGNPEKQAAVAMEGIKSAAATGVPGKYGIRASVETLTEKKAQIDHLGEILIYWRERSSWKAEELLHGDSKEYWQSQNSHPYFREIILCSMNVLWGRRIFHCKDGKFGLGPAAMESGDRVVVLFGGIIPYIIRPQAGGHYTFVGGCLVPGLMQGEAVEAAGLLKPGAFVCDTKHGTLRLSLESLEETPPRFQRKVGTHNVKRFEIR